MVITSPARRRRKKKQPKPIWVPEVKRKSLATLGYECKRPIGIPEMPSFDKWMKAIYG